MTREDRSELLNTIGGTVVLVAGILFLAFL